MATSERLTVNVETAARMLGISKNLAYDLARRGELPGAIRLGHRRIVVSLSTIYRLLNGKDGEPHQ